ncbi:MAG: histidine phosphatase family protein, partial [Lachnospiraceae bacterium]|nr:histidine phosphatase family protein [Lachnospiraceae bacterium]
MRLVLIRHAEPNYVVDSVTEKGAREAELLSERVLRFKDQIRAVYVSPLGRAARTAAPSLDKLGMSGKTLPWLKEYYYPVQDPTPGRTNDVPWDFMPEYWTRQEILYDRKKWYEDPILKTNPEYEAHIPDV